MRLIALFICVIPLSIVHAAAFKAPVHAVARSTTTKLRSSSLRNERITASHRNPRRRSTPQRRLRPWTVEVENGEDYVEPTGHSGYRDENYALPLWVSILILFAHKAVTKLKYRTGTN